MKILICGDSFQHVVAMLQQHLPEDEITLCPYSRLWDYLSKIDVVIPAMFRVDARAIDVTSARMVHQFGVGLEGVDVAAATRKGIYVANVPGSLATSNAVSVAEHAIFFMLALARRYPQARENLDKGVWGSPLGIGFRGKTVGVLGMGNIGQALVERLRGFEVRILGIKRHPSPEMADRLGLEFMGGPEDLAFVLGQSDFLVLALPVTEETRGIIGEKEFAQLKEGSFIINVGRGPLIDQDALVQALSSGSLGGAGLDVFREEPVDPRDPIFDYNVIATPHVGGVTDTSYDEIARALAANVDRLRAGLPPENCVNLKEIISSSG